MLTLACLLPPPSPNRVRRPQERRHLLDTSYQAVASKGSVTTLLHPRSLSCLLTRSLSCLLTRSLSCLLTRSLAPTHLRVPCRRCQRSREHLAPAQSQAEARQKRRL